MKDPQLFLPEAVRKKLIEEAEFMKKAYGLNEHTASLVERALFRGARIMKEVSHL